MRIAALLTSTLCLLAFAAQAQTTILQPLSGESVFAASDSAMATRGGWIWFGTSKGTVLRTKGSANWQRAQTPLASGTDSSGVFSLAFRDQKHGIAVGGDYVFFYDT